MRYTEDALVEAVAALGWDVTNDDTPDIEGGTNGGGTELPPTGSVPDKG